MTELYCISSKSSTVWGRFCNLILGTELSAHRCRINLSSPKWSYTITKRYRTCLPFQSQARGYTRVLPPLPRHCTALPALRNWNHLSVTCPGFSSLMWTGLMLTNEPASKSLLSLSSYFAEVWKPVCSVQKAGCHCLGRVWELGNLVLWKSLVLTMILNCWGKCASKNHTGPMSLSRVWFFSAFWSSFNPKRMEGFGFILFCEFVCLNHFKWTELRGTWEKSRA